MKTLIALLLLPRARALFSTAAALLGLAIAPYPAQAAPVALLNATATFEQADGCCPVNQTNDGNTQFGVPGGHAGWGIQRATSNPNTNPETAEWRTATDVGPGILAFTLIQDHPLDANHLIGRFRLSITTDERSTFANGLGTGGDVTANWMILANPDIAPVAGLTFTVQPDHSILVSRSADFFGATYVVTYVSAVSGVTGVRLEVLADPSLPDNGPGMNETNGNFLLTEITLDAVAINPAIAGSQHSVALRYDGTVWAWGRNDNCQAGTGDAVVTAPQRVSGLDTVVAIGAGFSHSIALQSDGSVRTWGSNLGGQLGDGTTTTRCDPVTIINLGAVTTVAAGGAYSLVLKTDGTVAAWGDDAYGQLGIRTMTDVIAVAAGDKHSLALKSDRTVWASGRNQNGELGDGTTTDQSSPIQVSGLSGVIAIAAGGGAFAVGQGYSLALKSDRTLWAWGGGVSGDGTQSLVPVQVTGPAISGLLENVTKISTGWSHFAAIRSDGSVWTRGLGSTVTEQVPGSGFYTAVSAGFRRTVALQADGSVWAWGDNDFGSLGVGGTSYVSAPAQVLGPGGSGHLFLAGTTYVSALLANFNLTGNALQAPLDVLAMFGTSDAPMAGVTDKIEAVWAWNAVTQKWKFHTPQFTAAASAAYALANNYEVLTSLPPGTGYWVSATQPLHLPAQVGAPFNYDTAKFNALPPSFSLLSTGSTMTVQQFNASVGIGPSNFNALWVWDASRSNWYFYSPQLEQPGAQFTNLDYCTANGYQDFAGGTSPAPALNLQPGVGFWVEK